jgi:hypothetical protein
MTLAIYLPGFPLLSASALRIAVAHFDAMRLGACFRDLRSVDSVIS